MSGWKEASCGIFSCTVSIGYFNGNHWKRPSMNVHDEEICSVPVKDIVEKIMAKRHHLALQHQIEACLFDDLQDYGRHQLGCHAMFSDLFWRCGRFTRASWYPAKFVGNGNASIHLFFSTWPTAARLNSLYVLLSLNLPLYSRTTPPVHPRTQWRKNHRIGREPVVQLVILLAARQVFIQFPASLECSSSREAQILRTV